MVNMAKKINIQPLGNRVLVEPEKLEKKTESGIVLPDTIEGEKPSRGTVRAVGAGKRADDGSLVPPSVKKGDMVLFSKYASEEIEIEGKKYLIIDEGSLLAVISE